MAKVTSQTPEANSPPEALPTSPKPKPRRRWLVRLCLLAVGCLLAAIWFAPLIVAQTSLKQRIPKFLFPQFSGHISIGSASLDWLQPVVIGGLNAEDSNGQPILEVKEFSTTAPLWKLALVSSDISRLKLDRPRITVDVRSDGSNLEDVVAELLSGPSRSTPPDFELEVNDATIFIAHKRIALSSTIESVSLILKSKRGTVDDFEMTVGTVPAKDVATLEPPTDWLAFRYGSQPTQDGVAMTPGSKHLRLKAVGWNLEKLRPALTRIEPEAELAGTVDADLRSQINLPGTSQNWTDQEWSLDGRITVKKLVLAGISSLKKDRVSLETTSLAGRLAAQQQRLSMDRVEIQTEVGEFTATGDIPLTGFATASAHDAVEAILGEQDYAIHAHLDLQRLAALLPTTLRVRDDTRITSGRVEVNLKSEKKSGFRSWLADATVDQLAGTRGGQNIAWNEPFRLTMQAHRDQQVTSIDQATCNSGFFTLAGQGTLTDAKFKATVDLPRLEEHLQKFIDFGLEKLLGTAKLQGEIRRMENDQVSMTAALQLDGFEWNLSKEKTWKESRLVLSVMADGTTSPDSKLKRIESAEIKLTSGQDILVTSLQQAVDVESTPDTWPVKATVTGDLSTWQNRLIPFFKLDRWQFSGTGKLDATADIGSRQIDVASLTADLRNLDIRGPEWWITEPQVKVETSAKWSVPNHEVTSPLSTLTGTAISIRLNELIVNLKPEGGLDRVTGSASYRGDLDKLSRWKNQALQRPSYYFSGTFEGQAHLIEHDSAIALDLDTTIKKLLIADLETMSNQQLQWVALWREPELRLVGKGSYDIATDRLQMDVASLQTEGLNLNLSGSLLQVSSAQRIDMKGDLGYDWQILCQRMGESYRKSLQLTGKQTRPISLRGSLASLSAQAAGQPVEMTGNAGIGWDSATIFSMAVGSTDVNAQLDQGVCQFAPISTTIAGGQLHLTPQIRLDQSPAVIVLPAEKVLDEVQMTPQMCNAWIKFVAPLLADSTEIDGKFSLDLAGGTLPTSAPLTGNMTGSLAVHQMQIRPGTSAMQVMGVINQIQSLIQRTAVGNNRNQILMEMPEQSIPIKLAAGRMYHQNMTFAISGTTVQSSGSVGIDESIDFVLLVKIKDEWTQGQKLLAGLKGQSLKIPVGGTLSRPQIDSRILTELATQLSGTALEGAIDNKLDDLFKTKLNKFLPGQN